MASRQKRGVCDLNLAVSEMNVNRSREARSRLAAWCYFTHQSRAAPDAIQMVAASCSLHLGSLVGTVVLAGNRSQAGWLCRNHSTHLHIIEAGTQCLLRADIR
jgi:hypothetical protein